MFIWHQLHVIITSLLQNEAAAADKLQSVSLANKSLLQLSLSLQNGSSISRKFRHPCLRHIHFLIVSIITEIGTQFQQLRSVDDSTCNVLMQQFSWLRYFVQVLQRPIGCRTSKECISEIAVHWQWLRKKLIVSLTGIGFQFSQQLNEAMQQFELSFGINEAGIKIQRVIQSVLGHPHPFHSSSAADAFTEAYLLCRRLERKSDSDEVDSVRISLRRDVQKMKLRLADCLTLLDENNVQTCVSETKKLSDILMTNCDLEDTELSAYVALYPVCRLLAEVCEARFAADIVNHITRSSAEINHFVSYCSQCTAVSPLTLCSFQHMLPSLSDEFCVSRSLIMRSVMTQSDGSSFGMLCCSTSRQILSILSASDVPLTWYSGYSCIPSDFTLGDGNSRCLELRRLNHILWTNAHILCEAGTDMYKSNCRQLDGTFRNLMSSLQSLLPAELFDVVDGCLAASKAEMYVEASESISDAAASSSKLMMLIPDWPSQLSNCLQQIVHVHLSDGDECRNTAVLGAAWVEVGLLKMQLLAPRSLVDPSYRLALKLHYANEQLQDTERYLKVHNWQASLSTGQQLPTDCHPMIAQLCRQQEKLQQWISDKNKLVAYRPELTRYLALIRDIRQFVIGLGSPERIRDLVKHLLVFWDGDVPVHGAIEEVKTLKAAVNAFVSRIEQDYLLYCDIVVPFLVPVAETMHGIDLIVNSVQTAALRQKSYSTLHCKHDILSDCVRCLVQFPVSYENLKSGSRHTACGITFDSLMKSDGHFENDTTSSQFQLRYRLDIFQL